MPPVPASDARNHPVILFRPASFANAASGSAAVIGLPFFSSPASRTASVGQAQPLGAGTVAATTTLAARPLPKALPDGGDFILLACHAADAVQQAHARGSRIGLLLLEHADDVACLEHCLPLLQLPGSVWIGLVASCLLGQPPVRECIAELLCSFLPWPLRDGVLPQCLAQAADMAWVREQHARARTPAPGDDGPGMVGKTPQMQKLFDQLRKVARTDASVLITGASGTGKELAALSIHRQSARRNGPFVAVNCGAIAPQLFQSELFGHEKGAFTGAGQRKIGRIEAAQGGTLFLDEIGDMPFDMQVNLLRFLQEKTIERVGGTEAIPIDVRVLAATHVDLADAVAQRRFREDLYYRINVVCVAIPRLADRGPDIEDIAHHYFARFARAHNRSLRGFSKAAMQALLSHSWPGNVRELVNRVQRAAVMAEGRFIQPEDLGFDRPAERNGMMTLEDARAAAERVMIRRALSQARNQVSRAATLLGVSRVTLYRLIDKYNIQNHAPATLSSPQLAANDTAAPLESKLLGQP
jgi:DNA-binding NtrC family response regulator